MVAAQSRPTSRVLIADDSDVCRGVLVILLETAGYEVVSVYDGNEAVKALRNNSFDLAILDNDMPNLSGVGALTELRGFLPRLPVVVCSGTVTADQALRYRELGIDDLIKKPVDPRTLREKVATILARGQALASNSPFGSSAISAADIPQLSPLTAGKSKHAAALRAALVRLKEFRTVALVEGGAGSGRFELALNATHSGTSRLLVCHADDFEPAHLDSLFKPVYADKEPALFIVLEADRLPPERQVMLEKLMRGRLEPHGTLAKRLRLLLSSAKPLDDIGFNEFLLLRASTATYQVPAFDTRRQDWTDIAEAILYRANGGRGHGSFAAAALRWIDTQEWPGDYMQLHRTIELARLRAGINSIIREPHLMVAYKKEPEYREALYHDHLFHQHSGDAV